MKILRDILARKLGGNASKLYLCALAAVLCIPGVQAAPVAFEVSFSAWYTQSDPTTVEPDDDSPYNFGAFATEDSDASVFTGGTVQLPSGVAKVLTHDTDSMDWDWSMSYASLADCTAECPSGSYTMKLTKVSGGTVQVSFSVNPANIPAAPRILNYDALQSVDPSQDLVVSWDPLRGATSSDAVRIDVYDENGDSIFTMGGGLDRIPATDTSATIPSEIFSENSMYELDVSFYKLYGYSSGGAVGDYPSAAKVSSCGAITAVTIATTSSGDASIFSSLSHKGEWVVPEGSNTAASFGWINDATYPWVYSIAADTIANGGKYMASGKGWMYVLPDGASLAGFYFYSYATDSWCWANYNWNGWVYDYKAGKWIDFTPAK